MQLPKVSRPAVQTVANVPQQDLRGDRLEGPSAVLQ